MPSLTLTVDAASAQRVLKAFGRYWKLQNPDGTPRDATLAEVRDFLERQLKGVVRNQERAEKAEQAEPTIPELPVT